jgi:hypothetical protein
MALELYFGSFVLDINLDRGLKYGFRVIFCFICTPISLDRGLKYGFRVIFWFIWTRY